MTHILAEVQTIHSDGNIIARAVKAPRIGDGVTDSQKRQVGVVRDIFGSVSEPYISIRPYGDKKGLHRLVGEKVYIGEGRNGKWTTNGRTKKPRM